MKISRLHRTLCFQSLFLLPLLTGCSSERRDELWQIMDPAGYKHAHSESFNGARAIRSPHSQSLKQGNEMSLELNQ